MNQPLIDVRILDENERLKHLHLHPRVVVTAQAMYAHDLIKSMTYQPGALGNIDVDKVVGLAVAIVERAFAAYEARGWVLPIPPGEDMIERKGATAGFMPK